MKRILLLLLIFTFSCAERELQLPVTTTNEITEVLDVSPIYIFYDAETGEADFNRNNMISTTNWLVNIDKRLTLKQVLPHLQYLQEKRQGDGMHKNKNAKNYFTCFNEDTKSLSFMEFTDLLYYKTETISEIKDKINNNGFDQVIFADFYTKDSVKIGQSNKGCSTSYKISVDELIQGISYDLIDDGKVILYLKYYQDLNFQDYINVKSLLLRLGYKNVDIAKTEFISN